jgi:hypothetical protein
MMSFFKVLASEAVAGGVAADGGERHFGLRWRAKNTICAQKPVAVAALPGVE